MKGRGFESYVCHVCVFDLLLILIMSYVCHVCVFDLLLILIICMIMLGDNIIIELEELTQT